MEATMTARPVSAPLAAIGGLLTLAVVLGIGRFVYTPILPLMAEALGWSMSTAGLIASANFAGYLIGALFAVGALPGSRRRWLLSALVVSGLTTGAMGLTHAVAVFLALRFAGGVASALALILASEIVLEVLAAANRAGLFSVLFAGVGVGIAASAALVSGLQSAGLAWPALWIASGVLSLAAVPVVAALTPAGGERGAHSPPLVVNAALLRLVAAYGLFGFSYIITATFLVVIVRDNPALRHLEPAIWVVFGLAAVPSIAAWAWVARRLGLPAAFAIACLTEAVGVVVSVAWRTDVGTVTAAILVGGTFMALAALGLVRGRGFQEGDARRVLALMTTAFSLGQIIGPSFAGALFDRLGSFAVPSFVAAAVLVVAAALSAR